MRPRLSVKELSALTDLSPSTINRIIGPNPRDIHVTAVVRFAELFGMSPQKLMQRAIDRAGGMEKIQAEMLELAKVNREAMSADGEKVGDVLAFTGRQLDESNIRKVALIDHSFDQEHHDY